MGRRHLPGARIQAQLPVARGDATAAAPGPFTCYMLWLRGRDRGKGVSPLWRSSLRRTLPPLRGGRRGRVEGWGLECSVERRHLSLERQHRTKHPQRRWGIKSSLEWRRRTNASSAPAGNQVTVPSLSSDWVGAWGQLVEGPPVTW